MSFITNCIVGLIAAQTAFAKPCDYTQHGLTWTKNGLRMNQIQVVGTHNSYHIEAPLEEQEVQKTLLENTINYWYSHPSLGIQLTDLHVRNLELDVFADPEGGNYARPLIRNLSGLEYPDDPALEEPGTKVLHVADADIHTQCVTFIDCLKEIKSWMDKHPKSVPIPIMVEFKVADQRSEENGGAKVIPWDNEELLEGFDKEIRSVFSKEQLITPDHIRRPNMTLEDSVLKFGWPDLESARGRIFFLMDNGPDNDIRYQYLEDRPNLEGRVLFTNAAPGDDDCAFQKLNDPTSEEQLAQIQDAVSSNYWVRTRSDVPLDTVLNCSTEMREQAFRSGAQIVSTDFPEYGPSSRWSCDFAVKLEEGRAARCNPVNAPAGCEDDALEKPEYVKN